MAIQLNTDQGLKIGNQTPDSEGLQSFGAKTAMASILGGAAVKVVSGAYSDLEALIAKLKNENERTKFSLLLTSLASIGQSLSEQQKRMLEQGLALSEKLKTLDASLTGYSESEASAKAEALIMQQKIDSLQKQIEQAVKDGKEHNDLVAEQKRVRKELDEKNSVIADVQNKIAKAKNEIASINGQISAIIKSIGLNEVKTLANELSSLADPERAERPAEAEKEAAKKEATDPLAVIRDSLAEIERDIAETIEENRIEMA